MCAGIPNQVEMARLREIEAAIMDSNKDTKAVYGDVDISNAVTSFEMNGVTFETQSILAYQRGLAAFTNRVEAFDVAGNKFIIPHHWVIAPDETIEGIELNFSDKNLQNKAWNRIEFIHESGNVLAVCEIFENIDEEILIEFSESNE